MAKTTSKPARQVDDREIYSAVRMPGTHDEFGSFQKGEVVRDVNRMQQLIDDGTLSLGVLRQQGVISGAWGDEAA